MNTETETIGLTTDTEVKSTVAEHLVSENALDKIVKTLEILIDMEQKRSSDQQLAFRSLDEKIVKLEASLGKQSIVSPTPAGEKRSILAEFGLLDEDNGDNDSGDDEDGRSITDSVSMTGKEIEEIKALAREEALASLEDAEIRELKDSLKEKIRETEVAFSIRRSKLEQREAKLEERLSALESQEKDYRDSAPDPANPENSGMLGRLKKHLSVLSKKREQTGKGE